VGRKRKRQLAVMDSQGYLWKKEKRELSGLRVKDSGKKEEMKKAGLGARDSRERNKRKGGIRGMGTRKIWGKRGRGVTLTGSQGKGEKA
jgi:hypothetical protein